MLNTHAPKRVGILKENYKPHYKKDLRKTIRKRSRFKDKANKLKDLFDITNYKKQRNLVVSLNRQAKPEYFNDVSNSDSSRPFWDIYKRYFSNKHARGESKIMLIENNQIIFSINVSDILLIPLIYMNFLMKRSARGWMILIT